MKCGHRYHPVAALHLIEFRTVRGSQKFVNIIF